jgi:phage gp37-like protein
MALFGYRIEQIEDAILDALKADSTLAAYVRTFDRLPWDRADEIDKLVLNYPAVLVAYVGQTDDSGASDALFQTGTFAVWCCARNLRSPSAASRGEVAGEAGAYDLLDDVAHALHHSGLGLDDTVLDCRSMRVEPLAASARMVVFSRELEIEWLRGET